MAVISITKFLYSLNTMNSKPFGARFVRYPLVDSHTAHQWALIELARNVEIQQKLRGELRQLPESDPSWEQLMSGLPYLDAVVHETLRLHPPGEAMIRVVRFSSIFTKNKLNVTQADEDDIIPLGSPITLASGRTVELISIPKGTIVTSPFIYINTCETFWGPDAKQFVPERWLGPDNPSKAKDLGGHRQIYTFSDGPRICLGKTFALAELKASNACFAGFEL